MARAVCWALVCLAVARTEARYADYSGAKMPQYGGGGAEYDGPRDVMAAAPPEDYVDPPAAASIAADYKYDDDTAKTEKSSNKDVEDSRERQTISKRHRPAQVVDEENSVSFDISEDETKLKTSHQFLKPRIQTRTRNPDVGESRRHAIRYSRNKFKESDIEEKDDNHVHREELPRQKLLHSDDEESNNNIHVHNEEIRRRKGEDALMRNDDVHFKHDEPVRKQGLEIEDENIDKEFVYRTTTMRVARRKPRDRYVKRPSGFEEEDDEMWQNRLVSANRRNFENYPPPEERPKVSGRRRLENEPPINEDVPLVNSRRNYVSSDDDDSDKRVIPKYKDTNAKSDEYKDYSYDMKRVEGIRERLPILNRRSSTVRRPTTTMARTPDLREMIMANRRAMVPLPKKTTTSTTTTATTTTTETPTTAPQATTSTEATTNADTITIKYNITTDIEEVLSLAEKSRLSILKKSQKKESEKGLTTTKPVVLMQVTRQMHTLVMVEPPTSVEPWMRAKVVSNDSPSRLKKVKRLMRQKLVQNAKSIHDLTENWDEMVCDYVDVAMVDTNSGNICFIGRSLLSITFLIYASWI